MESAMTTNEKKHDVATGLAAPTNKGLARILRAAGAAALVTGALTFMMQRWAIYDHITRYIYFLAFTAMVFAGGLFCILKLKEDKGARTLLALAAAIIPCHFAQLGAFVYSRFGAPVPQMPSYFLWSAPSDFAAVAVTFAGWVLLAPMAYMAFSVLYRPHAKGLTVTYMAVASGAISDASRKGRSKSALPSM